MIRLLLVPLLVCTFVSSAAADARSDAATAWIDAAVHGTGTLPAPTRARPVKVVFDSGTLFQAGSACAKLRVVTMTTASEMAQLATCLQDAMTKLALAKAPVTVSSTAGVRYLRSWFARRFHRELVVPRGRKLIGTSISRPVPNGAEGEGVAVMVYVLVDASNQVTAVYAYAGAWAYPV